jgi:ParB family chromosome partitioning protein
MAKDSKDTFQLIPIEKLQVSKTNPRKSIDTKFLAELTDSIKSKGILEPLLVRSVNSHFEIVAGEQRYKAGKEAKLKEVPAIIKQLTDEEALEIQVIENVLRKDIDPFDEAVGYQRLMDKGKYDVKLLSEKLGKSENYIYTRLRLNKLIQPLKKLYETGWLQLGHVLLASKHTKETQDKIHIALLKDGNSDWESLPDKLPKNKKPGDPPTVQKLTKWLNNNTVFDLSKVCFDITDKVLHPNAGDCISCRKNTSNELTLFEGAKKNLCTDRICRDTKTKLFLEKKFSELKKKEFGAVCITTGYWTPKFTLKGVDKIYTNQDYVESPQKPVTKNSCDNAKICLVVDKGYNSDRTSIGTVKYCCFNKNCKLHTYHYSSSGSGSTSAADKKKQEAARIENKYRCELLKQISSAVNKDFTSNKLFTDKPPVHLIIGAKSLWSRTECNEQIKFANWFGYDVEKKKNSNYGSDIEKAVNKSIENSPSVAGIFQFMFCFSLFHETEISSWIHNKCEQLDSFAKKYRINSKQIKAKFVKEAAEKNKKKAEKKPKSKSKKK